MKYGLCKNSITLVSEQDRVPKCSKPNSSDPKQTNQPDPVVKPTSSKPVPSGLSHLDAKLQHGLAKDDIKENLDLPTRASQVPWTEAHSPQGSSTPKPSPRSCRGHPACSGRSCPAFSVRSSGGTQTQGQELTETPEALALTHAPAKAASFHTKSAFHTPGYPWRAGSPFPSHLSFHIKSHPQGLWCRFPYVHPSITEYPPHFYTEHGLATIYSPYLLQGTQQCDSPPSVCLRGPRPKTLSASPRAHP